MTTIKGIVEAIEYRQIGVHEKKVVTVVPDHRQCAFVEFRGRNIEELNNIKVNDEIIVEVILEGKVAKNSGIQYNNLVAQPGLKKI